MTAEQEILDLLANDTTDQFRTVRWIHDNLPTNYDYATVRKYLRRLYAKGYLECYEKMIIVQCYPRDDRKKFTQPVKVKVYRFD